MRTLSPEGHRSVARAIAKDYLALGWAHSNVVDFHEEGASQDVHVKILEHKSFRR